MTRTVFVVPHTHWDREWYQPHELFRWRLVRMIDELIDRMECDPAYRCFNLDGQSIVIADYLELRPEQEPRLRALIESGRVLIGPWWVQPDEFLPSGESHVRNLQRGLRYAEQLGGGLRIGHCADQFGHIAQLPQIMAALGLTSACLWRGVPDEVPGWSFWWEAPDGTRLPVLYLRNSYSSGWRLPRNPLAFLERVRRREDDAAPGRPLLLMNGTDHSRPEYHVPALLAGAGGHGYELRFATLPEYEDAVLAAGVEEHVHRGELRSPDRSNILAGVLSARANLKQRDFAVSAALERYAEPLELLSWLHGGPDGAPALRHAWGLLLENAPHDSICGCSVDQVHAEMLPRYDRAEQLAREVARESAAHLVANLAVPVGGALAAWRPVPHAAAVLETRAPAAWEGAAIRLPGGEVAPCALGPPVPGDVLYREDVSPRGALRHLDFIREGRYDLHHVEACEWRIAGRHLAVETTVGDGLATVDTTTVRDEIAAAVEAGLATTATVTVRTAARRTLRAVLPPAPAIGLDLLTAGDRPLPKQYTAPRVGRVHIANQFYEVRYRRGAAEVHDLVHSVVLTGAGALADEGDRGDEYNADILPGVITRPASSVLLGCDADAVSATLRFRNTYLLPAGLDATRARRSRDETAMLVTETTVTLWAGLPRIDFRVTVENNVRDHRLRALFPLPIPTERAWTENQFHVAERSLAPAPWNGESAERPPTTFPQKSFAAFEAGGLGLAVFNRGLQEGEVVRDRRGRQAYALTLLRSVGWLSRNDLVSRRGGAGPLVATPGAQLPGRHTFDFALTTYLGSWRDAGIQSMAHSFAFPPVARVVAPHEGAPVERLPLASIAPEGVVPSALCRSEEDGTPIIRVYNASGHLLRGSIAVPAAGDGAERVDLAGRRIEALPLEEGAWRPGIPAWGITTVRFGRR